MPEVSVAALKETVETLSGAGATFRETASVTLATRTIVRVYPGNTHPAVLIDQKAD